MKLLMVACVLVLAACSPLQPNAPEPADIVLQPADLTGSHWKLLPMGYWGGLAGAEQSCDGGNTGNGARSNAFARSDAFASTAITSERFPSSGIFTMVLRFPTEADARASEEEFAAFLGDSTWATCYAKRLKHSFATELEVEAAMSDPSANRESVHGSAATFDLEVATGLLYASEVYAWRRGRIVVYLGISGPAFNLKQMRISDIVELLWAKSAAE